MLIIRQVTSSDLEAVTTIEAANFSPREAATKEILAERIAKIPETFLIAEMEGQVAAYIEGPVIDSPYITDNLFYKVRPNLPQGGYQAVTSLSVAPAFKGQGLGTALLAALKDLTVAQGRLGITLTCHEELIAYYEMNGFANEGLSESTLGGAVWYNMTWAKE